MADIYGQLVKAQLENLAADPTTTPTGLVYLHTGTSTAKYYDGAAWRFVADTDRAQTWTNKTLTTPALNGAVVDYDDLTEAAAPGTPAAGKLRLYAKTDGLLYTKDDAGTENPVGSAVAEATTTTLGTVKKIPYVEKYNANTHSNVTDSVLEEITDVPVGRYRVTFGAKEFVSGPTDAGLAQIVMRYRVGGGTPSTGTLTTYTRNGSTVDATILDNQADTYTVSFSKQHFIDVVENVVASGKGNVLMSVSASNGSSVQRPYYCLEYVGDTHVDQGAGWN